MTAPEQAKERTAAAAFVGFMALAAGPAGMLIAALAVGLERAWGGDGGRPAADSGRRQASADHRQWLAEDRAWRDRLRTQRQAWLDSGADAETEPARPSKGARFGRWLRRQWARTAVAVDDFRRGFRDGWAAARDAKARGGSFREVARTRPDHPDADRLDWTPFPEPVSPAPGDTTPPPASVDLNKPAPPPTPAQEQAAKPDPDPTSNQQEEPMTTAAAPPKGETNLDTLEAILARINQELQAISDDVDRLNARRMTLAGLISRAFEIARATGATDATRAALDAAMTVVTQLGTYLSGVANTASEAEEQVTAAKVGLAPARDAQDTLHSSGARGEFVSASTHG